MQKTIFYIPSSDEKTKLYTQLCLPDDTAPTAVLQVVHGITEYSGRYEMLCRQMTAQGIAVLIHDQIGHGRSAIDENHRMCIPENGWKYLVEDVGRVRDSVFTDRKLPAVLLGFSLGSFVVRDYMASRKEASVQGCILAGTGWQPHIVCSLMGKLIRSDGRKHGRDTHTALTQSMMFDNYNKKVNGDGAPMSWLIEQPQEVKAYLADPLCADSSSCGYFGELLYGMGRTCSKKAAAGFPDIPILLISGESDPVGDMKKGVEKFYHVLTSGGHTKVKKVFIPKARHDIFHCQNANMTVEEIVRFMRPWQQG